jgi:hypothetical protein
VERSCRARWCAEPNHHTLEEVLGGKGNLDVNREPIAALSPLPFPLCAQQHNARDDKYCGCSYRSDHGPSHRRIVTDTTANEGPDAVVVRCPAAADSASTCGSAPDRPRRGRSAVNSGTVPLHLDPQKEVRDRNAPVARLKNQPDRVDRLIGCEPSIDVPLRQASRDLSKSEPTSAHPGSCFEPAIRPEHVLPFEHQGSD